ncbi:MAG: PP2C family protein-serine/threonine phosphatase, partial [Candidatus Zixiibacteriota bacterium]
LEVASQIQKTLLPEGISSFPGLEIDAYYKAASRIGGDLYDAFDVGNNKYCIVVADVSGKGIPASLVMSMLRTVIRIFAKGGSSAREVLLKVNDYLQGNIPPGIFITLYLLLYDSENKQISAVSAGHNPMLYFKHDTGKIERINPAGMPLGLPESEGRCYADGLKQVELSLHEGDVFMLYTDGVTDVANDQGQKLGIEQLEYSLSNIILQTPDSGAERISREMTAALLEFANNREFTDDLTFIAARSVSKVLADKDAKSSNEPVLADSN